MRDTCGIHVSSEVIRIHAGYMRDTCGIHAGYMRDTYLGGLGECTCIDAIMESSGPQVGLEILILECIPMYPTRIVSVSCVSCI